MNRRNFLLTIPFIAVASKMVKPVSLPPKPPSISFEFGMLKVDDPKVIAWLNAHPMNAANRIYKNNAMLIGK